MKYLSQFLPIICILLMWGCQLKPKDATESKQTSFNEDLYMLANPDVPDLIKQGKYKSGLDHYLKVGQTAIKPNGEYYGSYFTGTAGNDIVQGIGNGKHGHFVGVNLKIIPTNEPDPFPLRPQSLGKGEIDVLIGTKEGKDEFLLASLVNSVNPVSQPFYVGQGDKDYAIIKNFTKSKDIIILSGTPDLYRGESTGGNVRIYTSSGDLVAIVEGVDRIDLGKVYEEYGAFTLK